MPTSRPRLDLLVFEFLGQCLRWFLAGVLTMLGVLACLWAWSALHLPFAFRIERIAP